MKISISLIVPVYNEEESIDTFLNRISFLFKDKYEYELIFVNDGSEDKTLNKLLKRQKGDSRIKIIDLSRNFGKEAALTAGLKYAKGNVTIPLDIDLQDPPEIIFKMIDKWKNGAEIVVGRRVDRASDSFFKRLSADIFYYLFNKISNHKIPNNVGDFRLMDKKVVEALNKLDEQNRFMKGLFAWVGFKTDYVDYIRPKRHIGKSKFSGWKLFNLAIEGITSFSIEPLKIWTYLGVLIAVTSIFAGARILFQLIFNGVDVPGYASLFVAITFLGGVQLIGIGILGEYLGRVYIESKKRPIFLVRKFYVKSNKK